MARTGDSVPVRGALGAGLCTGTCWRAAAAVGVTPWGGVGWGGGVGGTKTEKKALFGQGTCLKIPGACFLAGKKLLRE